jgi:lipoprotein-anchoring transpeptidase ErfK/SrfK
VLVLDGAEISPDETWYHVRLAILPNNSTGWVQGDNLGRLFTVHTHLYVDRARLTATLKRDGVTVFQTLVGIGRPASPTPSGEFYVRDKLTRFADPTYGPVAFGTSGRSAVLTDWPDGGVIGIHGGARPELFPGRVSHGCIHMQNAALLKLAGLMPVGTPLTIR